MTEPTYIDRPPRIQPELPFDEIAIPKPPEQAAEGRARLVQIGLPLLTIIGSVLVISLAGNGGNAWMRLPMALSVVASVAFGVYSYRKERRQRKDLERAYVQRLTELNKYMHTAHDMQRRFYVYTYPDCQASMRIVQHGHAATQNVERPLRSIARLWERRTSDQDFGTLRLGMGTLPSTVTYVLQDTDGYVSPQARAAMKLAADSRYVADIPVVLALRSPPEVSESETPADEPHPATTPIVPALGIAGECRSVRAFTRALLAHYAVFHSPTDARLYILASDRRDWAWSDHLPHSKADEHQHSVCFVNEISDARANHAADDEESGELEQFLEGIRKVLAQRKIRLHEHEERQSPGDVTLPFILLVVDLLAATCDATSPLHNIETDPAISILIEEGAALGAAIIFLVPERSKVPSGCRAVIEVQKTTPATNSRIVQHERLHFRYTETGINGLHYVGEADALDDLGDMEQLAQDLATLMVRQGSGAVLANVVPFLKLMGYDSLQELTVDAWRRWQISTDDRSADWLRAKIGLMAGNKPRSLVFSAKRDGVHGMMAGSTGSGKSELLISLITSMAVMYDPSVLNFVLVDYKGGSAFEEFRNLPHCVDVITNLAADGVTRMFTAIEAEMKRRQILNKETDTKHIIDYRQKNLHHTHQPYPFLFIIIDEFAEMIADRAEFKDKLESITRVGRAQGISLILAAQRPSGVTDQMRSNIKFRVCLRVETPAESREMLRRTDAAFLPPSLPGRGYLQVGNEEIELLQAAYSGDLYSDTEQPLPDPVLWPDREQPDDDVQDHVPRELYRVIIDELKTLAHANNCATQRAPWPDFLPHQLALSEPLLSQDAALHTVTSLVYITDIDTITLGHDPEATLTLNPAVNHWLNGNCGWLAALDWQRYALRPVIGLADNPHAAKQHPLIVDLPRGHAVVFGASGSGKTMFLRTLIVSLAATHSPDHFHAYIVDLGGRNMSVLAALPHVGAVVFPDEEGYHERVEQILRELNDIVEARKTMFGTADVTDLVQYNQAHPAAPLPAILVAIDNMVAFVEAFGSERDDVESVLSRFAVLARQSRPYGIHFVVSANRLGDLSNQLYNLFSERFALRMIDTSDYRAIVGGHVPDIIDTPGRGYASINRRPLSFQVALPIDLWRDLQAAPANEVRELQQFAQTMVQYVAQAEHRYTQPVRIDALPKAVLFKQLLARQHDLTVDETFLARLTNVTKQQWANSVDPNHAAWLRATIGVTAGNRPRTLQFEAQVDGVHGMVAGGTGAGKSELLMTLIVGLALNYDSSVLNFVLIDYKGGGAFKPFEELPHCVETMTNLNKAAVKRMFTAINAEMRRRQELNTITKTDNIVDYRSKGLHLTHEPYPHLFIIIDEYAEMITNHPEFGAELDSITRLGRAQGVSLLLASQRPIGVSDQMRANIKLRMCLRVEGVDTSREMLRRSDAAYLPNGMPGRGYIQIGSENVELVQVAYTGDPYTYAARTKRGEHPKFYEVIVQLANDLAATRPRTPWPPALVPALTLADPLDDVYLDSDARSLVTLDCADRLALNPFAHDWLEGRGRWLGIHWNGTAMRAVVGVVDDPYNARVLPLVIDFTRGHAVLFGASGWGKTTMLRSLVVSLAATHSPDELHTYVLDLGGRSLEVLHTLPHVGTVIVPDERGYEERVQQLVRELNDILDRRKRLFSAKGVSFHEYNSQAEQPEPAILIVIDNFAEFLETFGGNATPDDEQSILAALITLMRQGKAFGLHFIITANRLNVLSSNIYSLFTERLTLHLADASEYSSIVGGQVTEIDEIVGRGYIRVGRMPLSFQVALVPGAVNKDGQVLDEATYIRAIGQQMNVYIAQQKHRYREPFRIDALPEQCSYRQMLAESFGIDTRAPFLPTLQDAMQHAWQDHASTEQADWLQVTLGIASGNRPRTLHLEAKADGVHGMVAGGTGSGKSEILTSLIVGLAINYSPDILNFVLVDYKGGGAFKPFAHLPHCVDIVTNLNTAAVERMFTAINAEIRRRQALNVATGTNDIIAYRRKGLHKTHAPYPHLFIIIDEYAEMIDANRDYIQELESITRVGRAQGINLLLASQQPKGVTDQMRANIKLRLCLRVEQKDTSRELLRRPDAALLPNGLPGRGYLQIGNENIELLQVAYTGEPQPDDRLPAVLWPARTSADAPQTDDVPKLYDMVIQLASELTNGRMALKPWPAFLPTQFSLETPRTDAQHGGVFTLASAVTDWINGDTAELWSGVDWTSTAMQPVIGLLDDPAEARQYPLRIDLRRAHVAAFGDSGMGKTTLLRTILLSLIATHTSRELHAYILDLSGRNFRSFEDVPHVGAVLYGDEEKFEERLQRLLELLNRTIEARQQIMSDADVNNLAEFNARYPDRLLPAIVVMIDNVAELQENYGNLVENTLLPLIRRSLSVGICFVVTSNIPGGMPGRMYSLFTERVTFKQTNTERYLDIVGRGAVEIDDLPGRGYIRKDRRPLFFQVALPAGVLDHDGRTLHPEAEDVRQMAQHMRACVKQRMLSSALPQSIAVLAERLSLVKVLRTTEARTRRIEAVLGQNGDLQPALFDLKRFGPHCMIVGPPLSGKTTALYTWVFSLAERYTPSQVMFVLVDMQRKFINYGGKHTLAELPHVVAHITEVEQVEELTTKLQVECEGLAAQASDRAIFVIIDNFDDFSDEIERERDLSRNLARLVRRYGRDGLHFVVSSTPKSDSGELKRRIQAANYGIGLRTADAVAALNVTRTPAAIRDKELPVGRGFIVKSGQTSMIQVASPYDCGTTDGLADAPFDDDAADGEERAVQAIDHWIQTICTRYPYQQASWSSRSADITLNQHIPTKPGQIERMRSVLQNRMHKELEELQAEHNDTELITARLVQHDVESWNDPIVLAELLRALYVQEQHAQGYDSNVVQSLANTMDVDSLLFALQGGLNV